MNLLDGKYALVTGLANERSIAWGIARQLRAQGAQLMITCQNERLEGKTRELAKSIDAVARVCDLEDSGQMRELAEDLNERWPALDAVVHAAAFADRALLKGPYLSDALTQESFMQAHSVSVYSFSALAAAMRPLLKKRGGSLLTLSYLGSTRVIPNYNVMGVAKAGLEASVRYLAADLGPEHIRVNALSPGPIRTLAASGISGLREMLRDIAEAAPLRRNVTIDDVGGVAAFVCSDLAAAITGQIIPVDCGYSILGYTTPTDR